MEISSNLKSIIERRAARTESKAGTWRGLIRAALRAPAQPGNPGLVLRTIEGYAAGGAPRNKFRRPMRIGSITKHESREKKFTQGERDFRRAQRDERYRAWAPGPVPGSDGTWQCEVAAIVGAEHVSA